MHKLNKTPRDKMRHVRDTGRYAGTQQQKILTYKHTQTIVPRMLPEPQLLVNCPLPEVFTVVIPTVWVEVKFGRAPLASRLSNQINYTNNDADDDDARAPSCQRHVAYTTRSLKNR